MSRRYSAIDLRGYPNEMYEKVYTPKKIRSPTDEETVEICVTKRSELRKLLRKLKKQKLIFARGGDINLNRGVVREKRVGVLSRPYPIDDITAREAADNRIAFEINTEDIVKTRGYKRAMLVKKLKNTVRIAKLCHAPIVITSGSKDEYSIKSPRTLVAFGKILGLEYHEVKSAIYNVPKMILRKGRK
ncbi:MAG: RNase P subunit p30 family protein [Euryarchaeota archaeon]|nr:RNase P subunit p30 family protein [Euryarchaeota archaeon]